MGVQGRRDMPAMLSYEDFLAAALDTQKQLSAQSLSSIFSSLDQARHLPRVYKVFRWFCWNP